MPTADGAPDTCHQSECYEVRVQGHLDTRWTSSLYGMAFARGPDGTTTLSGPLPDQAALHGLLGRIRDLGLPIVSVRRLCSAGEGR